MDKLINVHISAANADLNLISLINFHINAFLAELVHAFRLTQEQNVHFFALRILVDEGRQGNINVVILFGDVYGLILHKNFDLYQ